MIRKLSSVYVLAHSGFVIRCCPMAESLFILEIEFLHIRGGCSLVVVFFVVKLKNICSVLSILVLFASKLKRPSTNDFEISGIECFIAY